MPLPLAAKPDLLLSHRPPASAQAEATREERSNKVKVLQKQAILPLYRLSRCWGGAAPLHHALAPGEAPLPPPPPAPRRQIPAPTPRSPSPLRDAASAPAAAPRPGRSRPPPEGPAVPTGRQRPGDGRHLPLLRPPQHGGGGRRAGARLGPGRRAPLASASPVARSRRMEAPAERFRGGGGVRRDKRPGGARTPLPRRPPRPSARSTPPLCNGARARGGAGFNRRGARRPAAGCGGRNSPAAAAVPGGKEMAVARGRRRAGAGAPSFGVPPARLGPARPEAPAVLRNASGAGRAARGGRQDAGLPGRRPEEDQGGGEGG